MFTEWTVTDSKTQAITFVKAKNQEEAIKEGLRRGVVPRDTEDAKPRVSSVLSDNRVMTPEEFSEFIEQLGV
ncbi:MAG: hypothetical protein ABEJ99_03930 [Candidatus Nanohaloarchaea archaeon]